MRRPADRSPEPRQAGVVTSLVAKRGRSDRCTVYLDGTRLFDLAMDVVERARLRQGDPLDEQSQIDLLREDAPHRARDKALDMLATRERCAREVEERLQGAGFDSQVVSTTISWLQSRGYVDDRRFAASFAEAKLRAGWGAHRIRAELLHKGTEREVVEDVLEAAAQEGSGAEGVAAVVALARKRFEGQFATDPAGARRRVAGYLARRGYDWGMVATVTRVLGDEADQEDESASGCLEAPGYESPD
jgi:regulatory protein